jgi:tRNA(Ile2) C34 agmatinyltransferase TiaS
MVKEIKSEGRSQYYQCEKCGFAYKEKEWAQKCESWCSTHQGCNLDITQYAIKTD